MANDHYCSEKLIQYLHSLLAHAVQAYCQDSGHSVMNCYKKSFACFNKHSLYEILDIFKEKNSDDTRPSEYIRSIASHGAFSSQKARQVGTMCRCALSLLIIHFPHRHAGEAETVL
jgi:hypothetical protein